MLVPILAPHRMPLMAVPTLGATILLLLVVPILSKEIGVSDDGNRPDTYTSRRAYNLISNAFGPGVNGALFAVLDNPDRPLSQASSMRSGGS